ncbi:helix-turn-helix transcriptional regulator [Mycolicibacterium sp. 050158]|uniref:helix-turn-helix transcriptional regulator n=1 Tax=Mycolicibacterium sp. 050158 TaxID=3090602 RepID=UPI00299CEA10|nr:helix-turn-helix transcriptional regulator [Mycolicibacterium sp. 050158]MDX1892345.1 helix-turn-helix transcriptional regulator [Mycolicibacterium sp. 050158]
MDQRPLARFLRDRRARLTPSDVGLPNDGRRRTAGLRREEVAAMAHISASYYTRLEQARASRPSGGVLDGLSRALQLDQDERSLLLSLSGRVERDGRMTRRSAPGIPELIHRMPGTAVLVLDAKYDLVGCNELATALFGDPFSRTSSERNLMRNFFLQPDVSRRHFGVTGSEDFARFAVSQLRLAATRYPRDDGISSLIAELRLRSSEFEDLWHQVDVVLPRHQIKRMKHSVVGPIEMHCDLLAIPDSDTSLVLFTAEPGTRTQSALSTLSRL